MTVPKWIEDLIWCGTPVRPDDIAYPEDPPGVLGPNTIRRLQRMMAPLRAEQHYRPIEILFSPADWLTIGREIERHSQKRLDPLAPAAVMWGFQLGQHDLLPAGFVRLRYASGRIELARLEPPVNPSVKTL